MKLLSPKQQQIIKFIRGFSQEFGYPPTIRDIMKGCNLSSTSVVTYNLNVLERARYIRRHSEVARGIELLTKPALAGNCVQVPIIGQIAAGKPIPVPTVDTWDITAAADTLEVTRDLTQGRQGVYALRVKGWSMVDALVNDGDIVLMEYITTVENGEVAAIWLKSEREATLKRFYAENGHIRLQPANSQMQPIYANPDNVDIQGRVIAVIRQLV
jgi:repressor LexA